MNLFTYQVNPSDLSNDADPKFLAEFYKNLKILSQDLYKKSVVASTNTSAAAFGSPVGKAGGGGGGGASDPSSRNPKLGKYKSTSFGPKNTEMQATMAAAAAAANGGGDDGAAGGGSGGGGAHHPQQAADYFTAESLHERMKVYAQQGGIPLDYLERYAAGKTTPHSGGGGGGGAGGGFHHEE